MAEKGRKRESRGYKVILTGIKGILNLLIIVCLLVVLFYLGRQAYALGHEAFDEKPVDIGEGRTVVVTITEDMSTYQIGRMLKAEGLLTESALAFCLQELISEYHNQILPGTYPLKTSMTTQDMFPILAQADKIEEGKNSEFIAPGMWAQEEEETAGTEEQTEESTEEAADADAGAEEASETTSAEDTAVPDNTTEETADGSQEETDAQ